MSAIKFSSSGDLSRTVAYLNRISKTNLTKVLNTHGKIGVEELKKKTPVRTGKTASSWQYSIETTSDGLALTWDNTNIQNGISVVQLIENGHASRSGTWVSAKPFVKSTIDDIEKQLMFDIWKEVNS